MGDKQTGPFQLSFNASLKIDFQGSRVTSDGGLILVRELEERHCRLLLAWGYLTRRLFGAILRRMEALLAPAGQYAPAGKKTCRTKEGGGA